MGDLDTQYEYIMCDTLEEYKETAEFSRTSYSSDNDNYMTPEIKYPLFTAEKQLELIKFISDEDVFGNFSCYIAPPRWRETCGKWSVGIRGCYVCHEQFEQALAGLVLKIWDGIPANQKQEIKEILE